MARWKWRHSSYHTVRKRAVRWGKWVLVVAIVTGVVLSLIDPWAKQVVHADVLTVVSDTSESAQNTLNTTPTASDTSIASSSLPAGTYFVAWGAALANSGNGNVSTARLMRGSTEITALSHESMTATSAVHGIARSGYWLGTLSGSEALTIQYYGSAGITHIDSKFIKAVRLDTALVEDTDFYTTGSQESTANEVTDAVTTGWTDVKALTKTFHSTATQNYLVFASMGISPDSTTNDCSARLEVDGAASMVSTLEGEDTADQQGYAVAKVFSIGSGSKSIKLQGQSVGGATCDFRRSRIYVFRTNVFDQVVENYSSAESTLASATWTDKNSQVYTPNQTENVMVVGSRIQGTGDAACSIATRINDGTTQYADATGFVPNNATTDYATGMTAASKLINNATTFKIQFQRATGACTVKIKESTLIIWSMTLNPPKYIQSAYQWYANSDSVQPGSSLTGNVENTPATIAGRSTIARLRALLTNTGGELAAGLQAFKLQYAVPGVPSDWCNDTSGVTCTSAWAVRRKITFNNVASAQNLTDFPVLVKLNSSRIDYSKTQGLGQDIRFVDPDNPNLVLSHEIEEWNESGTSYVWVKVPQINASSSTDFIWMYYGNGTALDGENVAGVWTANYAGVWHLNEDPTATCSGTSEVCDSTPNANHADANGSMTSGDRVAGKVSWGQDLDGTNDYFSAPNSTSLNITGNAITISGWVNSPDTSPNGAVAMKSDDSGSAYYGQTFESSTIWGYSDTGGAGWNWNTGQTISAGWHHVTYVYDGSTQRLYVDGSQVATHALTGSIANSSTEPLWIGRNPFTGFMQAIIDEVQVSNTGRSADWVEASYLSSNDQMNTYGAEDGQFGTWSDVADPWCNDASGVTCTNQWSARRRITFNNAASSTNLSDFPVLIKLDSSRIDYNKVQSDGDDLRFVDPSDPSTVLPHEIESWNQGGTSYVWVKVPQLEATSTLDYIWMYHGHSTIGNGQASSSVWNNNYVGVYHMNDLPTGSSGDITDSTGNNKDGTSSSMSSGSQSVGQVDGALDFDGALDYISLPSFSNSSQATVSAWFKFDATSANQGLVSMGDFNAGQVHFKVNSGVLNADPAVATGNAVTGTLSTGTWYYGTYSFTVNGNTDLYLDGSYVASTGSGTTNWDGSAVEIGHEHNIYTSGNRYFNGIIDEARISNTARSEDWIEAEYKSMNDTLVSSYSAEEGQTAQWRYYDNPTPVNGENISSALLSGTPTTQSYIEGNPTVRNPNALPEDSRNEWDFALDPAKACSGTYYFRMVKSDGTAFDSYAVYPQLTLEFVAPIDQVMRHGGWFDDGTEQPYSCDWVGAQTPIWPGIVQLAVAGKVDRDWVVSRRERLFLS